MIKRVLPILLVLVFVLSGMTAAIAAKGDISSEVQSIMEKCNRNVERLIADAQSAAGRPGADVAAIGAALKSSVNQVVSEATAKLTALGVRVRPYYRPVKLTHNYTVVVDPIEVIGF